MKHLTLLLVVSGLVVGCTGSATTGGTDSGTGGRDTGTGGSDTGSPSIDTGVPPTDSGSTADAGSTGDAGSDSGPTTFPDGGIMCRAGVECTNWASALAAASSLNGAAGATPDQALANCVIQMHQSDCCGARRAYGFNHAARTQLCSAESSCDMQYPTPPGCTSSTITVDTGATTTNMDQVRLRVVNPMSCSFGTCYTCETFVCTDASCATAPRIMPRQCG